MTISKFLVLDGDQRCSSCSPGSNLANGIFACSPALLYFLYIVGDSRVAIRPWYKGLHKIKNYIVSRMESYRT